MTLGEILLPGKTQVGFFYKSEPTYFNYPTVSETLENLTTLIELLSTVASVTLTHLLHQTETNAATAGDVTRRKV